MDRSIALRIAGISLLGIGIVALAWAFVTGEASIELVLIIPVIYGAGVLAAVGIIMIFGGIALLSLSYFARLPQREGSEQEERTSVKKEYGGVILIGPIPIVFGSARSLKGSRLLLILAILSLIALVLYLILILM